MGEDTKNKTFTLSVDLLLTIVLVLSIVSAWAINSLNSQVSVLKEKVSWTESEILEINETKEQLYRRYILDGKVTDK